MLTFHATVIECFSEFEEVLTVRFDNQTDHYLTLQGWAEGFEENAVGMGMVHVEVDDQINSGYDCLSAAFLRRNSFRVTFNRYEEELARLHEVVVTFDLNKEAFEQLRIALDRVFREFEGYRVSERCLQEGDSIARVFLSDEDLRMSPEEYAARNAHRWGCFSLHEYSYADPILGAWVRRLGAILFSVEEIERCRQRFLTSEELAAVRQEETADF
jgi:hypothetical protein